MAYFKELRKDWTDDQLAAWKESWKIKKDTWNKKRQPGSRKKRKVVIDEGIEEEKEGEPTPYVEEEPPRKKQRARKSEAQRLQEAAEGYVPTKSRKNTPQLNFH